jgi:3-hydroxyacyl-[acyl-carrier-protein] dehydratase
MRFVFVDEILALEPGRSIRAVKTVKADEELFKDHFPGFPVVPGVLLTEMMAQAAGKCLDAERNPRGKAMLARIVSASFRDWVGPNEQAVISAEIKTSQPKYATADCYVEVRNKKVCSAELLFAFLPMERLAPGYIDEVLESYLNRQK